MSFRIPGDIKGHFAPARRGKIAASVCGYLQSAEPRELFERSQGELDQITWDSATFGEEVLGLTKLSAHKRLAYLWVLTEGRIAQSQEAIDFVRRGGTTPDDQVKALLTHTGRALRDGRIFPDKPS